MSAAMPAGLTNPLAKTAEQGPTALGFAPAVGLQFADLIPAGFVPSPPGGTSTTTTGHQNLSSPASSVLKLDTTGASSHRQREFRNMLDETVADAIAKKLETIGRQDLATPLRSCHTEVFHRICLACGRHQELVNHCDRHYCPLCAPRLSARRAKDLQWWIRSLQQPKHVVLTIRNIDHLTTSEIRSLKTAFSRMRRCKFASNWNAGLWRMEVTNEGRGWHVHIHALIEARYIDNSKLSTYWNKYTDNRGYIVKVKDCRGTDYTHEVTKYVVKPSQLSTWTPEQIAEYCDAFNHERTFGTFGDLFKLHAAHAQFVREALNGVQICECGCNDWVYMSDQNYAWYLATGTINEMWRHH